jgi:lipopolysaccharide/colanic/teichoic acid biosynthesis glycosyltransferase
MPILFLTKGESRKVFMSYRGEGKRLCDFALTALAVPLWVPVWVALAIWVRLVMGRPAHFRQVRPGWRSIPFQIRKLRTMVDARALNGVVIGDEERMTRFGSLLRKTSLDELPTLWNVLKGDMSLVGPRPLLMQYLDRYSPEQSRRHEVRPGITGWAQVNGRNALSWEEKFKLDVWYVDHASFWLDAKILWMTLWKVFAREGISAAGHATMPEFMGPQRRHPEEGE